MAQRRNNFSIDARAFSKNLDGVLKRSEEGKRLRDIAKDAAKPWKTALRDTVYNKVNRRSGGLRRAITVRGLKKGIGAIAGVNFKSKGGWKAHFFRSGGRLGRINYQDVYAAKTPQVIRKFREGVINFVLKK